jgi:MarR family 2-MHQ and catechol resistance regulon transcriptional repressor
MKSLKTYGKRADESMKTIMRLLRVSNIINNETDSFLSRHNLTFNQFKVLEALYHLGDLNISSITKLTMSTPGNITVVVRNLVRDGFVVSKKDKKDSRVSILSITKDASQIMQEIFPKHAKNLKDFLSVLSDEELKVLHNLLNKIYQEKKEKR